MYKQDLEQTLLGIDEEAELEIGPRDDRPSVGGQVPPRDHSSIPRGEWYGGGIL